MKLYLVRHAEADGNLYRVAQGQDDSSVTERGLRQIDALARRFADIPVDAAYASDLYRTCRTAAAVCGPKSLPLHRRRALREICVGAWERRPWGEIYRQDPNEMRNFLQHLEDWHVPGGESPAAVQARMLACLRDIARANPGKTAAVFSHGCAIRLTLAALLGKSIAQLSEVPLGQNTAVSCLRWDGEDFRVLFANDASHLKTLEDGTPHRWRSTANGLEPGLYYLPAAEAPAAYEHLTGVSPARLGILGCGGSRFALLGCQADGPVGALTLDDARDAGQKRGWIADLTVGEPWRCRGYGTQLLGQAVQHCRDRGRETLCAPAPGDETARRFLTRQGFAPAGEYWEKDLRFPPLNLQLLDIE